MKFNYLIRLAVFAGAVLFVFDVAASLARRDAAVNCGSTSGGQSCTNNNNNNNNNG